MSIASVRPSSSPFASSSPSYTLNKNPRQQNHCNYSNHTPAFPQHLHPHRPRIPTPTPTPTRRTRSGSNNRNNCRWILLPLA